jgi:hypothetical protein
LRRIEGEIHPAHFDARPVFVEVGRIRKQLAVADSLVGEYVPNAEPHLVGGIRHGGCRRALHRGWLLGARGTGQQKHGAGESEQGAAGAWHA